MRFFASRPLRGLRFLRRLIVELRGIRRALERQADALELASLTTGGTSRESTRAQVFRSYERLKQEADSPEGLGSEVSYVDGQVLAVMLAREEELKALLGRDPTPDEVMAAYEGEVEIRGVRG